MDVIEVSDTLYIVNEWGYQSLKNRFHICYRWLADPRTSFWKAKSPTGTGALRKWVTEFFFVICKILLLSLKASADESSCQEWRNGAFWWREGREGGVWIMGSSQCQVWQNFALNVLRKFLHVLILYSIDWKYTVWVQELLPCEKWNWGPHQSQLSNPRLFWSIRLSDIWVKLWNLSLQSQTWWLVKVMVISWEADFNMLKAVSRRFLSAGYKIFYTYKIFKINQDLHSLIRCASSTCRK